MNAMPQSNLVLRDHPTPAKNVFLMMRFEASERNSDIFEAVREMLQRYDLNVLRADSKYYYDNLWDNMRAYMDASDMGIAVFDKIDKNDFNPNVSFELGYMIAKGKKLLILKEQKLKALPADILGKLYNNFDATRTRESLKDGLRRWLVDVGIAKSEGNKLVIFVSNGGTCRCTIAKVVLQQTLRRLVLPFRLNVIGAAKTYARSPGASHGARAAILREYGEDLLSEHCVTMLRPGLLEDADLIIPMDEKLCSGFSAELRPKVKMFKRFFLDEDGDVADPWPFDNTDRAPQEFGNCLAEIRNAIEREGSIDKLIDALSTS
jgi:protein-tyrosine-phosphatase